MAEPEIALANDRVDRGEVASAGLRISDADGLHAVCLRATTSSGEEADWLNQVVPVDEEGADVPLPVALNDPTGDWKIAAEDLYTGKVVTAELQVS